MVETEYILLYAKNIENVKFNNQPVDIDDGNLNIKMNTIRKEAAIIWKN